MKKKNFDEKRLKVMCIILAAVLAVFGIRLFDFQVISANDYSTSAGRARTRTVAIKAPRGEIVDRCGRPIATNRSGYDVVFNRAYMSAESINETVLETVALFKKYEASWNDILPLTGTSPYRFTDDTDAVAALKSAIPVNSYATAEDCYIQMVELFSLQSYDETTRRLLMGIRYSMLKMNFSILNPYTFANDVSSELQAAILESGLEKKGVEIRVTPYREYTDDVAPHIIGTVGKVDSEDWKIYKDKGYSYDDFVGKTGIEKEFEEYLRGHDGELTYVLDNYGNVVSSEITKEPVQGNTVVLTLDKRLQEAALSSMVKCFKLEYDKIGIQVHASSCLAVEVKTGQILTAVSFPSYTMNDYRFNYDKLLNDPYKPLFNRAFEGTYAPGSLVKMAMACCALDKKVTTPSEIIDCVQTYDRFDDYKPKCLHKHGNVDIVKAIGFSCNYFFFEMAYRLKIADMNEYFRNFGLGEYTGIELAESKGILAGPEYSASVGEIWTSGSKLAAAIGQQNNAFTPIQLLMYCSTIANGGTRYRATLIKEIRNRYTDEVIFANEPEVMSKVEISDVSLNVIREGMRTVTIEGTSAPYYKNYPIATAGKTGTAQTGGELDNTFYITFAPYDDAEIAVVVVSEKADSSMSTVPVTRDVLNEYFFNAKETDTETPPNTLKP